MLESGRCRGNVGGIECRVWGMKCGGLQHRGWDSASTYVLHPGQRTRSSLISGETKQGDNGIVLLRQRMTGKDREQKVTLQAEELTMSQRDFYTTRLRVIQQMG